MSSDYQLSLFPFKAERNDRHNKATDRHFFWWRPNQIIVCLSHHPQFLESNVDKFTILIFLTNFWDLMHFYRWKIQFGKFVFAFWIVLGERAGPSTLLLHPDPSVSPPPFGFTPVRRATAIINVQFQKQWKQLTRCTILNTNHHYKIIIITWINCRTIHLFKQIYRNELITIVTNQMFYRVRNSAYSCIFTTTWICIFT